MRTPTAIMLMLVGLAILFRTLDGTLVKRVKGLAA